MNIIERLEQEAKSHPGATGEGVRIALRVLQEEYKCGACKHCDTVEVTDRFGYCAQRNGEYVDHDFLCGAWEACQG